MQFFKQGSVPSNRHLARHAGAIALLLSATAQHAHAQGNSAVSPATAAVIARMRVMADAGDGDKARTLLDSLVNAAPRESLDAAEGLYWRASLAEQSPSAERDWKQLVVEIPQSPRVPEALLRLSELDIMHNNTTLARQHAKRVVTDYPDAPERTRAMLVMAQSYFTDNDAPRACGVLTVVRREAPLSAVEVRLQADEMQQQCRNVREIAMGASAPTPVAALPTPIAAVPTPVAGAAGRGVPAAKPPVVGAAGKPPATSTVNKPPVIVAITPPVVPPADIAPVPLSARGNTSPAVTTAIAQATRDSIASAIAEREVAARIVRDSLAAIIATRDANAQRVRDSVAAAKVAKARNARDSIAAAKEAAARTMRDSLAAIVADRRAALALAAEEKELAKKAPPVPTSGRWTIQVAAYDTRADADALVKKLNANDLAAHTVGVKKPFRVQVGRFATRPEAADALNGMKKKSVNGFISEWAKR